MLRELQIKNEYRSLHDNIPNDFYIPLLNESIMYKRSVGYFSSKVLIGISYGIEKLIKNGGFIRLICSPNLDSEDIIAINSGYQSRINETIEKKMLAEIKEPENEFEEERLNYLANLIASNKLDIKVALSYNKGKFGLYHEKLGLFYDKESNIVAFSGSMNETYNAVSENYEAIDVFKSWNDPDGRVLQKENAFDSLWDNVDKAAHVLSFPDAVKNKIVSYKKEKIDYQLLNADTKDYLKRINQEKEILNYCAVPYIDECIQLRDYQKEAIIKWEENNFCGIYDMATGSGKTYTAYASIVALINKCVKGNKPILVIVLCPYQHLVEQWMEDIDKFHIDNRLVGYGSNGDKDYVSKLKRSIRDLKDGVKKYQLFISTNATYRLTKIQDILKDISIDVALIVDEAHYVGTKSFSKYLNQKYKYRLALSATIDRYRDEFGTSLIHDYFGSVCIKYTLEDAIKNNNLSKYYYYPVINVLTYEEREKYERLTKQIKKLNHGNDEIKNNSEMSEELKLLLIKRSLIVAAAENKLANLEELMSKYINENYMLVYCGATRVTDYALTDDIEPDTIELRQIDQVTRLLGNKLGMNVKRYTSKEDVKERMEIRSDFAAGQPVNALVAIKCLDEGVNIPNIRKAFILASTTNPREYVQRRGRVLRKAKGKEAAYIFDFITIPYELEKAKTMDSFALSEYKTLIKNELKRMKEYFMLAENKSETYRLTIELEAVYKLNQYKENE